MKLDLRIAGNDKNDFGLESEIMRKLPASDSPVAESG